MLDYRSISDLNQDICNNLHKVPKDIDMVVGIPRSGLLAANLLALHLNLPLTTPQGLIDGHLIDSGKRQMNKKIMPISIRKLKVFVLDDSIQSGSQLKKVKTRIDVANLPHEILYGVIYASRQSAQKVDIYFEKLSKWRVFEWNVIHHPYIRNFCVDIDGVLCQNPTEDQNDDGPKYSDFIVNVKPVIIPSFTIGWLVTCRLEKYRQLTEQWLMKHGVKYRKLVMLNFSSKAERVAAGLHSKFKADVYDKTGAMLFIESSDYQAKEIASLSGKPVFCFKTRQMVYGTITQSARGRIRRSPQWVFRKLLGAKRRLWGMIHQDIQF